MLYTEMITTGALIHGDKDKHLSFNPAEHPLAIQLGGSNPEQLGHCARLAEDAGYDEINLNVGCPSDRVQSGRFGACLMLDPHLVADCIAAMNDSVRIPVTVKTRIGVDDSDDYEFLHTFVRTVAATGCTSFIIHARKAWLRGLSPRQNREIPALDYAKVHQIKKDFPELEIIINGGFVSLEQIRDQYAHVDGVMVGRAACNNPYLLASVDESLFGDTVTVSARHEILEQYIPYVETELHKGNSLSHMTRNIFGLFQGQAGARAYRRYLGEKIYQPGAGTEVIRNAMALVKEN